MAINSFFDLQALQGLPHFPGHPGAEERFRQRWDTDLPDLLFFPIGIQTSPELFDLSFLHVENLIGRGNRLLPDKVALPHFGSAEFGLFIEGKLVPQGLFADLDHVFRCPAAPETGVQQISQEWIEGSPSAGNGVQAVAEGVADRGLDLGLQRILSLLCFAAGDPVGQAGRMVRTHGAGVIGDPGSLGGTGVMAG